MENEFEEIAIQANKYQKVQTIMNYVNKTTLIKEHLQQVKGKAIGIDGVDKTKYSENLIENIDNLLNSMKSFSYKPKAVRRTYIPKAGSNKLRPLGIPAYEDKLVQGVMRKVLDKVYQDKFYDFSYGFRNCKNCHQAIHEVNQIIMTKKINYIVDADIKGFFDNVDHTWLIKFLENDIQDKNFIRYIARFLKSGIMEDMKYYDSDKGTPQGGLISPVLANIYLHYVLDMWFQELIKAKCKGEAYIVRYADDFICFFQYEEEANEFYKSLKLRLAKFGLELSDDKSKIIQFGRFAKQNSKGNKLETFDFLGFTHINGTTINGKYRMIHRTSKKKLKTKKEVVKKWIKENIRNKPYDIIKRLNLKLRGHYSYYGISGNFSSILSFYKYIKMSLYKALIRRSQRFWLTYKRYIKILEICPIIEPKIYVNIW